MTRGKQLALVSCLLLGVLKVWAQETPQRLESIVLDTFDSETERSWIETGVEKKEARQWIVRGSKFTKEGWPRIAYPDAWPTALFDSNPDNLPLKVLGVNGRFNRLGFNYIELFPAVEYNGDEDDPRVITVGDKKYLPQPYRLPGIAKAIDIWVWGSNYRYTLEIHIRDSRGVPYVLQMGSLSFKGWRNLTAQIPSSIPQTQNYLPSYLGLTLTKIVVRTEPGEKVDNFFVYFDNMKILTDMHTTPFDGRDLARPEVTDRVWGNANTVNQ